MAYAELPLAQHAFDVLASLRCQATTSAVADFLEAARFAADQGDPGVTPRRMSLTWSQLPSRDQPLQSTAIAHEGTPAEMADSQPESASL